MEKDKDEIIVITDVSPESEPKKEKKDTKTTAEADSKKEDKKPVKKEPEKKKTEEKKTKEKKKREPMKKNLTARFAALSIIFSLAVIIAAPAVAYYLPKNDGSADAGLEYLRRTDKEYLSVLESYDTAASVNETLASSATDKQTELDELGDYQTALAKISESIEALQTEKTELESEISDKQTELDKIEVAAKTAPTKTITWSSGVYTVGVDVPAGNHTITGSGSIVISVDKKSVTNKYLSPDGEDFTLHDGEKIRIDGSAKIYINGASVSTD